MHIHVCNTRVRALIDSGVYAHRVYAHIDSRVHVLIDSGVYAHIDSRVHVLMDSGVYAHIDSRVHILIGSNCVYNA